MIDIMSRAFEAAEIGALLEAQIFPLNNHGNVRVTCNWLYSALNCDPNDSSEFLWVINKASATAVTLSPKTSCIGQTIYASVRPDWSYYVQVQAPYSADWITAAAGDEMINMESHGLTFVSFKGLNNNYIAIDSSESSGGISSGGSHSGYRIRSDAGSLVEEARWFLGVQNALQPAADELVQHKFSEQDVLTAAKSAGWTLTDADVSKIARVAE